MDSLFNLSKELPQEEVGEGIYLHLQTTNLEAFQFYQRLEFQVIETVENYLSGHVSSPLSPRSSPSRKRIVASPMKKDRTDNNNNNQRSRDIKNSNNNNSSKDNERNAHLMRRSIRPHLPQQEKQYEDDSTTITKPSSTPDQPNLSSPPE